MSGSLSLLAWSFVRMPKLITYKFLYFYRIFLRFWKRPIQPISWWNLPWETTIAGRTSSTHELGNQKSYVTDPMPRLHVPRSRAAPIVTSRTDESTELAISQKLLLPYILKRVWLTLTGDWNSPDRQPMVYFVILVCDLPLPLAKCYGVMDGHSTSRLAPILVVNGHDKTSLVIQNVRLIEDSDVRITSKACHTTWKMQLQILVLLWNGQESSEILLVPFFLLDEKDIEYYWPLHLKACA